MTWTYPTITEENKKYIIKKLPLVNVTRFVFLKYKKEWFYILNNFESQVAESTKLTLVIIAKDYNPKKYETLLKIFCKFYVKTGNPVQLVKPYLSVFTTGCCSTQENGNFFIKDFENNQYTSVRLKGKSNSSAAFPTHSSMI